LKTVLIAIIILSILMTARIGYAADSTISVTAVVLSDNHCTFRTQNVLALNFGNLDPATLLTGPYPRKFNLDVAGMIDGLHSLSPIMMGYMRQVLMHQGCAIVLSPRNTFPITLIFTSGKKGGINGLQM